jgi:hypothetical protein
MASFALGVVSGTTANVEGLADNRFSFERKMGHSEASYFLPSRATGVNDMYRISPA